MVTRPTDFPSFATASSNITAPASGLVTDGYATNAVPSSANINWLLNSNGKWAEYLDQERAAAVLRANLLERTQQVLNETQAAQSIRMSHQFAGFIMRDVEVSFNALGSIGAMCVVGDSGAILTKTQGGKFTTSSAVGSGYTGSFYSVCVDNSGNFICSGADKEVQSGISGGGTFTRRLGGGGAANDLYAIATSGTALLIGGEAGELWYATAHNGTYSSRTSPDGSANIVALHWDSTASQWILITSTKIYVSSSATAANGTWTLKLTLSGTSPTFLGGSGAMRSLATGNFMLSMLYTRNSGQYGHAYSTDHGATWTQSNSVAGSTNHGNPSNIQHCTLDNTMVVADSESVATGALTLGVFPSDQDPLPNTTNFYSGSPIMTGACKRLFGLIQTDAHPLRMKVRNNQIFLIGLQDTGSPTDTFLHISAPYR